VTLLDRISGQVLSGVQGSPLFGQIAGPSAEDRLVPDRFGRWFLADGAKAPQGGFAPETLVDEQDAETLIGLGRVLCAPEKADEGWIGWTLTSPLAPGLHQEMEEHPLERALTTELHHLSAVLQRPRTHIRQEAERLPVHLARKMDPRAARVLSAHTEDWQARTLSGVQPRRVLARVREEDWALYENRVAARLLHELVAWLRRRIHRIRRVLRDVYLRLAALQDTAGGGGRYRADRIYRLWGQGVEGGQDRELALQAILRLEGLLYRLLALMDAPLLKNLPRGAHVPDALHLTNLFTHDAHYRGVARLWTTWRELGAPPAYTAETWRQRMLGVQRGFEAWCALCVIRALEQLGVDPAETEQERSLRPGVALSLGHGLSFEWSVTGVLTISEGDTPLLRVVPVAHPLTLLHDGEALAAMSRELRSCPDTWTLALHPLASEDHRTLDDEHLSGVLGFGAPPQVGTTRLDWLAVSPFAIDSVERLARALRWVTLAPAMISYPPAVGRLPPGLAPSEWLGGARPGDLVALRRPARPGEREALGLEGALRQAHERWSQADRELEAIQEELRGAKDDRRRMAELNREKHVVRQKVDEARQHLEVIEAFSIGLQGAEDALVRLARCPICRSEVRWEPRADDCFRARCLRESCGATLELRRDPETGERHPHLLPGDADPASWQADAHARWVDDVLGADVLTVPEGVPSPTQRGL